MTDYIISCESTTDITSAYLKERNLSFLRYTYIINGQEYEDSMGEDPYVLTEFYENIEKGIIPSTTQINIFRYEEYFENLISEADRIIHIVFGSGMTGSINNAEMAAVNIMKKHPGKEIKVIDSLCSCSGYGLLVDYAADMRDGGSSYEDVIEWVTENRTRVHHQFFTVDLKYFRRTGRMSGPVAGIASILSICPIMHLDYDGRIIAYDKVRGKMNAARRTVEEMKAHANNGTMYSGKCFISHSNSPEEAEFTRDLILNTFPEISEIRITDIGIITACHCGPGTIAVYFMGDDRKVTMNGVRVAQNRSGETA